MPFEERQLIVRSTIPQLGPSSSLFQRQKVLDFGGLIQPPITAKSRLTRRSALRKKFRPRVGRKGGGRTDSCLWFWLQAFFLWQVQKFRGSLRVAYILCWYCSPSWNTLFSWQPFHLVLHFLLYNGNRWSVLTNTAVKVSRGGLILACNGANDILKSQKIHSSPNKQPTKNVRFVVEHGGVIILKEHLQVKISSLNCPTKGKDCWKIVSDERAVSIPQIFTNVKIKHQGFFVGLVWVVFEKCNDLFS